MTEDLRTMGQSQGCSGGAGPSAESAFGFSTCLLFYLCSGDHASVLGKHPPGS